MGRPKKNDKDKKNKLAQIYVTQAWADKLIEAYKMLPGNSEDNPSLATAVEGLAKYCADKLMGDTEIYDV